MKRVFSLFLCLLCVCAVTAQIRGNEIRVVVSPDHSDWVYRLNEKCTFTVRVLKAQNLLSDVKIDYELGPEMYPTEVKKDVVLKDGTLKLQGTMKTAGFLRCKVKAHVDGRTYEGLATSAYAPEQLQPVTKLPADFRDYWAKTLEEARILWSTGYRGYRTIHIRKHPLPYSGGNRRRTGIHRYRCYDLCNRKKELYCFLPACLLCRCRIKESEYHNDYVCNHWYHHRLYLRSV